MSEITPNPSGENEIEVILAKLLTQNITEREALEEAYTQGKKDRSDEILSIIKSHCCDDCAERIGNNGNPHHCCKVEGSLFKEIRQLSAQEKEKS